MPQTQHSNVIRPINLSNDDLSAERKFKQRVRQIHRRRVSVLMIIFCGVLFVFGSQLYQVHQVSALTQTQLTQQQKKLKRAHRQRSDLRTQVQQLHNSEYLDNLIRYRFNYSRDGEIIYNIPNDANKNLNF